MTLACLQAEGVLDNFYYFPFMFITIWKDGSKRAVTENNSLLRSHDGLAVALLLLYTTAAAASQSRSKIICANITSPHPSLKNSPKNSPPKKIFGLRFW
jgi:hypothetical protein